MIKSDLVKLFLASILALTYQFSQAQCPNFSCSEAIPIGCTPTPFENYDCPTSVDVPILQHPVATSVFCGGTQQFLPQWWTFDVPEFGWYNFYVGGLFESTAGTGNYGALEGIMWRLAKGECNSLEWIAASQCPTWPPNCFCSTPAWAGNCNLAPCTPKIPLIPFWYNLDLFPTGSWLPYDPTQQQWSMEFPLSAGTYYILTTAFTGTFNGESWPLSFGEGNISICTPNPLPVELLSFDVDVKEKDILTWSTATETNNDHFNVWRTVDGFNLSKVASVLGAVNSSSVTNYQTEVDPLNGQYYYILEQVDLNGDKKFVGQVSVSRVECIPEYFTITGQKVVELVKGVYIQRCGDVVTMVVR